MLRGFRFKDLGGLGVLGSGFRLAAFRVEGLGRLGFRESRV